MDGLLPLQLLRSLDAWSRWAPLVWLRTDDYAYPALQTVHLVGLGLLFGTVCAVDLRILGRMPGLDLRLLARHLLPWTWCGFALALASGVAMFATMAGDLLTNNAFLVKMGLLLLAGANAGLLHARGPLDGAHTLTRWQARASMLLWIATITSGRWIAYA